MNQTKLLLVTVGGSQKKCHTSQSNSFIIIFTISYKLICQNSALDMFLLLWKSTYFAAICFWKGLHQSHLINPFPLSSKIQVLFSCTFTVIKAEYREVFLASLIGCAMLFQGEILSWSLNTRLGSWKVFRRGKPAFFMLYAIIGIRMNDGKVISIVLVHAEMSNLWSWRNWVWYLLSLFF